MEPDNKIQALSSLYDEVRHAWPIDEAKKILERLEYRLPEKGYVLFETGYGPSGLPHIGTFGEVARTTMVRRALEQMSGFPTRLLCVSDDMDGMRKIPDNIPNSQEYEQYLGLPLTGIPDPFGQAPSFAHNMNGRLRAFLDSFRFSYEFMSASDHYKSGGFNEGIRAVMANYDQVMAIMLPTLGPERRATYSPFMPVCPRTGRVLQVPIVGYDQEKMTISYHDPETGDLMEVSPLDGGCKLQWKVDFGMRWAILGVDFEMYGKDHLVNGKIYSAICQALGGNPPHQMFYELFLDDEGQKISKSKGNGLTIEDWLCYAPQESLSMFMYVNPQRAKKLSLEVVAKTVDEYLLQWAKYYGYGGIHSDRAEPVTKAERLANPVHHAHFGAVPRFPLVLSEVTYALLVNLAGFCGELDPDRLYRYIARRGPFVAPPEMTPGSFVERLLVGAINYYRDHVKPSQVFRPPTPLESQGLVLLRQKLEELPHNVDPATLQSATYAVARELGVEVKSWFKSLYEITFGQETGPRFGSFIHIYGVIPTIKLINSMISKTSN